MMAKIKFNKPLDAFSKEMSYLDNPASKIVSIYLRGMKRQTFILIWKLSK